MTLTVRFYAEARNECRGPSLRHSAWLAQKCRSGGEPLATVCGFSGMGIEP